MEGGRSNCRNNAVVSAGGEGRCFRNGMGDEMREVEPPKQGSCSARLEGGAGAMFGGGG